MQTKLDHAIKLRQAGQLDEAKAFLQQLLAAHPSDPLIHYHLAWVYDLRGEELAAVPHYEAAIANGLAGEDLRGTLLGLGSTYRTLGEYEKSRAVLQRGIETFPDAAEFPVFLAMSLYNLGQAKDAVAILLKSLVMHTGNTDIRQYQRAILLYADDLDRVWK